MIIESLAEFLALLGKSSFDGLSSSPCPTGLQLHLDANGISDRSLSQINKLLDANEKRQAILSCVAFCQGFRSLDSQMRKLPYAIADHVFSFVVPPVTPKQMGLFFTQIKRAALPVRLIPTGEDTSDDTFAAPAEAETKASTRGRKKFKH